MDKSKNNKKKVFINTFYITLGSIFEKITFFFITVIIARYLSKENYGEYSTALGLATFFSLISNLNIGTTAIRAINLDKSHSNEYYTGAIIIKCLLSAFAYICLYLTLIITNYNENIIALTLILGIVRIGSEFTTTLYSFYEAKEKFNLSALFISLFSTSLLIGTIIIVTFNGNYFHLVNVRLLITMIFIIIILYNISRQFNLKFNLIKIKEFMKGMLPFTISFILGNITLNSGILLLPMIHGSIYAGIYQNAFIFIMAIAYIPTNLIRVLIPFLYKYNIKDHKDKFQFSFDIYSKIFAVLSFYIFIVFYFYSSDIISIIFGQKYMESIPVLKIFSFGFPFIFSVGSIITMTIDKQKINTIIDIISTVLNIVLSILLIYFFKAEGAAASFVIMYVIIYVLSHFYLIYNNHIKYYNTLIIWIKLFFITALIFAIQNFLFFDSYFLISLIINSLLYMISVILLIVKKDDIRILKEIIAKK